MGILQSPRLRRLQRDLDHAESYDQWLVLAREHDDRSGASEWRETDDTNLYDHAQIRERLDRLRKFRRRGDNQALLFTLNEGVHGNIGGMGKSALYARSLVGTKQLIESYVDEVAASIRHIAELDHAEIGFEEKYDFFHRASLCYGRSALMLSGGGSLGHFHLGVVKALMEQRLMPRVLSGASAGSVVSAIFGSRTPQQMKAYLSPESLLAEGERLRGKDVTRYETRDVEASISRLIPDLTFQEAYELTGHYINISVAPAEVHQTSRLLNAITSPNVYLREAVIASCAVPGVYPAVMLMAKNVRGKRQPYLPKQRWIDGSVSDDLPAKRLARLYGVNHYIGSLINPIVMLSNETVRESSGFSNRARTLVHEGLSRCTRNLNNAAQKYAGNSPRLNLYTNMAHSVFSQNYNVDVALFPRFEDFNLRKLISPLGPRELLQLLRQGELAAWRNMGRIRVCSLISHVLDEVIEGYEDQIVHRSLHHEANRASRTRGALRRKQSAN